VNSYPPHIPTVLIINNAKYELYNIEHIIISTYSFYDPRMRFNHDTVLTSFRESKNESAGRKCFPLDTLSTSVVALFMASYPIL